MLVCLLSAVLLVAASTCALGFCWVGNLIQAIVNNLALREMGKEPPRNDFGGAGTCFIETLVLAAGAVMPFESTIVTALEV